MLLSRVHEYGGGAAAIMAYKSGDIEERILVSEFKDGSVSEVVRKKGKSQFEEPKVVISCKDSPNVFRYADFGLHPSDPTTFLAIQEDHTVDEPSKVVNTVVLVRENKVTVLVEGNDFYSCPRWNSDGSKICWITWSHPMMPWDRSQLFVASIDGNTLSNITQIAGSKDEDVSVSQPRWSLSGNILTFLCDKTNFLELYVWTGEGNVELLNGQTNSDVGGPDWIFDVSGVRPSKWYFH